MKCWKRPITWSAGTGRMSAGNWSNEEVLWAVTEWAGAKQNTALYSVETSSRHGQERSRKQRGLWINKFCQLSVNASPKALETKHSPGNWFFAQLLAFWLYQAIPFCLCAKHLSPTQLFCIARFLYVSTSEISQKELCLKFWNNCKKQTIRCQNLSQHNSQQRDLWSSFPSFSMAQSSFCFTLAVEYTKASEHNCVVHTLMLPRALPTLSIAQGGHKAGGHRFSHSTEAHSVSDPPMQWAPFPEARRGLIPSFCRGFGFLVCLISGVIEESHGMQQDIGP